ncbi:P-loop NTPase fold protein [Magnetospirillum sp. 64-120]|uniref:P-loop NTPase fold protein n=1 Tax=Magnetospirillum sp. 64-120 TaxID=1895778 RepID=UPI00092BA51C|nr:P-loop NTPase fold protein [Magnetospirillum sp. 64-120]OJX71910.1 MAG: hypothetical protein BGO92_04510 [Magnetospirillum sp. 64-120]
MPANNDVREYLNHYLSPEMETDYAVMLTGPWGAGKTHFIKSYFKSHDDNAKTKDPLNDSRYLYASLYGVRSTAEITDQFFTQANPAMGSKIGRLIGSVLSRGLNGYAGTEVTQGAGAIIKDLVTRLDGKVLVFDDLERCAMQLVDVMGFINAYVEHDGLKVIVIANEDDIPAAQQDEYFRKKEKLVGKTLRVASDPKMVLESIVSKLTHAKVRETIERDESALLRTFAASGRLNFRSLRAVLFDYQRLVSVSDPRLAEAPPAMSALLLLMIAIGMEFRGGGLSGADIASLEDNMRRRYFGLGKDKPSADVMKAGQLAETYSNVLWRDWVVPPEILAKLFETGLIDIAITNEHLARHPLVVGYAETPAWRQLWSWADLPRSQYLRARDQLIAELREHALTHPGVILHAAGIVLGAAGFDDYMLGADVDVVGYFKSYVEHIQSRGLLEPERDLFGYSGGAYAGLGYGSHETPEFKAILSAVRSATFAAFAERMRLAAPSFFDRLKADSEACSLLHKYRSDGGFADAAILHHIDVDAFAHFAVRDWVVNGQLLSSMVARYEGDRRQGELADEHAWLDALRTRLDALSATAEPPHKALIERRIGYYFGEIGSAVNDTKAYLAACRSDAVD